MYGQFLTTIVTKTTVSFSFRDLFAKCSNGNVTSWMTIDFPCITEEAKIGEVQVKVQPLHDWQDLHQTVVGVPEIELMLD